MLFPFEVEATCSPLDKLFPQLARALNDANEPQHICDDRMRAARAIDAEKRQWTVDVLAVSMNVSRRHAQSIINTAQEAQSGSGTVNRNLLNSLIEGFNGDEKIELTIVDAWQILRKKFAELGDQSTPCPVRSDKAMKAILDEGVKRGVFTKSQRGSGRWKEPVYRYTNKWQVDPSELETVEDKVDRAVRSFEILHKADDKDIIKIPPAELGESGVRYLKSELFDTNGAFAPLATLVNSCDDESRKIAKKKRQNVCNNFATLMTLTASLELKAEKRTVVAKAVASYAGDGSYLWPLAFFLHSSTEHLFREQLVTIKHEIERIVRTAVEISAKDVQKYPFTVGFALARLK